MAAWLPADPWRRAVLALLLVLGAGLRVAYLSQPLRYDEAYTFMHYASRSFSVALTDYTFPNNHLLHTALVRLSSLLFGTAPWALRMPAVLAGVLLVPMTYLFARRAYSEGVALFATALVATSSQLILYSTNSRGYALVTLIFLALLILGHRLTQRDATADWALFAVLAAVGMWTTPIMLFGFGSVVLWMALRAFREPARSKPDPVRLGAATAVAGALTLIAYTPVIRWNGLDALVANRYVEAQPWGEFLRGTPEALSTLWGAWHSGFGIWVQPLLAVGVVLSVALAFDVAREHRLLLVATFLWCASLLVLKRHHPYERVWLFLLPLYFTVASAGWATLLQRRFARWQERAPRWLLPEACVAVAAVLAWSVVRTETVPRSPQTGRFTEAEQVIDFIAERHEPTDVMQPGGAPVNSPLAYYWARKGLPVSEIPFADIRRVWVVLAEGQRVEDVITDSYPIRLSEPRLLARIGSASVYQMTR